MENYQKPPVTSGQQSSYSSSPYNATVNEGYDSTMQCAMDAKAKGDYKKAIELFLNIADNNKEKIAPIYRLEEILKGIQTHKDQVTTVVDTVLDHYKNGSGVAAHCLGFMCEMGYGRQKDLLQARNYYTEAEMKDITAGGLAFGLMCKAGHISTEHPRYQLGLLLCESAENTDISKLLNFLTINRKPTIAPLEQAPAPQLQTSTNNNDPSQDKELCTIQ